MFTKEFLNKFFENMLFQGTNELDSKYLIISNTDEENVGVNVGVKTVDGILSLIESSSRITILEMAEQLNKAPRTIERTIQKLKQDKKIARVGSDKNGSWKIINGGDV